MPTGNLASAKVTRAPRRNREAIRRNMRLSGAVCTENLIRIDPVTDLHNVTRDARPAHLPAETAGDPDEVFGTHFPVSGSSPKSDISCGLCAWRSPTDLVCDQRAEGVASILQTESSARYLECDTHEARSFSVEFLAVQVWGDWHRAARS
jgi:hypothetical protein